MPTIVSVAEAHPENIVNQADATSFAREMFKGSFKDIDRLLRAFENGFIQKRNFVKDLSWFSEKRSLSEKNDAFIESAVELGSQAIQNCLIQPSYLHTPIPYEQIDAIFTVCTTGMATPSIEARIMNRLPFSAHTKRIPIWGLGCAGGASGLARAHDYCKAYPNAMVLVLSVELCSLTFQHGDRSKSNLIGTSLFADGVACTLVAGEDVPIHQYSTKRALPKMMGTQSTLMRDSLDVMGWDVKNDGLYVVFSKDIPSIVETWLRPNIEGFLQQHNLNLEDISQFIAHPGGRKVLEAYQEALSFDDSMLEPSLTILREFGNMSSATIFYVLNKIMSSHPDIGEWGLATALGPGFSSDLVLVRWESV